MKHPNRSTTLLCALLLAACGQEADDANQTAVAAASQTTGEAAAAAPNEVTVTTGDYFFEMPDEVPAGLTTFRLVNRGPEIHHVSLIRLAEGKTLDDLVGELKATQKIPSWAVEVGGPNPPAFGEESNATVRLEPGDYAVLCFVPSPDGTPHVMKGMMKTLTVTPAPAVAASEPEADIIVTLTDYDFQMSAPLTAGEHTIRFENTAPQAHEMVIVQLAPGKTATDFLHWVENQQGPPPGKPMGGIAGMSPGQFNIIKANFTPGEYALLCFIPDAADGRPHFMHGMAKQVTVS